MKVLLPMDLTPKMLQTSFSSFVFVLMVLQYSSTPYRTTSFQGYEKSPKNIKVQVSILKIAFYDLMIPKRIGARAALVVI